MPKVCEIFNVGVNPAGMAITPNGKYCYVANSNNYEIKNSDSVTVLDLKNGLPKLTIHDASFLEPYRIAIDEHGKFAYVCNSSITTVTIIDIEENKVAGVINGFNGPTGITISHHLAYVTNYGAGGGSGTGNTVSVVDLKTRTIIATITTDLAPVDVAVDAHHHRLYVLCYVDGNFGTGLIDIVDTKTNTVIDKITGLFGPFAIKISKDGRKGYVSNFGSNNFAPYGTTLAVVDLKKKRVKKYIELGIQPSGVAISPDDKCVYVANYNTLYAGSNFTNLTPGQGTVNVICTENEKVIETIETGQSPSTLTIAPDGKKLYVTNYVQNVVRGVCL